MVGYKHPCRYCDQFVPAQARVCPFCGKVNPVDEWRCPQCRNPVEKGWVACSHCGLHLKIACPTCGEETFLGDYCETCDARLLAVCPHRKCGVEQPLGRTTCVKCAKPL